MGARLRPVRPTPAGVSVAVGALACLLGGVLLGYPELDVVGVAGLLALLLAVAWVWPRPALAVERSVEPARVPRGDPALGLLEVRHTGRLPSGAAVAADAVAGDWVDVDVPRLRAGAKRTLTYRLPTSRRGRYDVGPLVVTRCDPLRLVRHDAVAGTSTELWVHPRVLPAGVPPVGLSRDLEGPARDNAPDGSITFQSLREYVLGDDLRRVHWRTTARTGTLMVRQHVDTSRPEVVVLLDDRAGAFADEELAEQGVDLAASLATSLRRSGFPCRVQPVSGLRLDGGQAEAPPALLLDGLAQLPGTATGEGLLDGAVALASRTRGGTAAALVTGTAATTDLESLVPLRRSFRRVLALCLTTEPVPGVRGVQVLDGRTAQALLSRWSREAGR